MATSVIPVEPRPHSFPRVWALTLTVFQSAFSEYALKTLVLILLMGTSIPLLGREQSAILVGAIFAVPFVFFSTPGGYLADRFSKRRVTIITKVAEVAITAVVAVAVAAHNIPLAVAAALMLRTAAAIFGPSKYGLLPELLPESRLSWANGLLQVALFSAIVSGSWTGTWMADRFYARQVWAGTVLLGFAAIGLLASLFIPKVAVADPQRKIPWNPFRELGSRFHEIRRDRALLLSVLGCSYFYFLATLLQFNTVIYGTRLLGLSEARAAMLLGILALAVGVGSLVAGYLSNNTIEYGLVPIGTVGVTIAVASLAWTTLDARSLAIRLAILGFFAGLYIVPLAALTQHRPDPDRRGAVIGVTNLLAFFFVFAGAALYYALTLIFHLGPRGVFVVSGILTLAATIYALNLLPESFMRFCLWVMTHSVYRIRVIGRDNIPERGPALLVSNHMSFVDTLLLIASTDRVIRFVIFRDIYDHPFVKPIAKMMGAIPISSKSRPREVIQSLQQASDALRQGDVVCIFAEGQITRVGHLLPFRRGLERITKGSTAPIVPVYLDDPSGSLFSFERGRFWWRVPRQMFNPVTVGFGKPLPPNSTAFEIRQAVQDLSTTAYAQRKRFMRPLHWWFINNARRHP